MGQVVVEKSMEISAPAQAIWEELVKVNSWPDYKPFVKKASTVGGPLSAGSRLKMTLLMGGPAAVPLTVTISEFVPGKRLAWTGGVKGVVSAVHSFDLEESGGKTKVTSREEFQGALLWVMLLMVTRADLENLHQQWVLALKNRMENPRP